MLRVGLTGELGSGKSTVARLLAAHGAVVLSSDEMGRALMQPGQAVYQAIVDSFGPGVLLADGQLDRPELARLAFNPEQPRVDELNALVHPAVLAEQERRITEIARTAPDAIVVIESALIFTTKHGGGQPWRTRFDRIILVTAPDEVKIERFVQRSLSGRTNTEPEMARLREDAVSRLSRQQVPVSVRVDFVIRNDGGMDGLAEQVHAVWKDLQTA